MPRLTDEDRELILADFHTGHYTQRELSRKYDVSTATINKLTKGINPKHEQKVNVIVEATGALYAESEQNEHEVNAVVNTIEEKTRHLRLVNNIQEKALMKADMMLDQIDSPTDLKTIVETVDKAAITLKVADRHAKNVTAIQVNNEKEEEQRSGVGDLYKVIHQ